MLYQRVRGDVLSESNMCAGVCAQQSTVSSADCQIAGEALELLVTCLSLRQNLIPRFVNYSLCSLYLSFLCIMCYSSCLER